MYFPTGLLTRVRPVILEFTLHSPLLQKSARHISRTLILPDALALPYHLRI